MIKKISESLSAVWISWIVIFESFLVWYVELILAFICWYMQMTAFKAPLVDFFRSTKTPTTEDVMKNLELYDNIADNQGSMFYCWVTHIHTLKLSKIHQFIFMFLRNRTVLFIQFLNLLTNSFNHFNEIIKHN